MTMQKRPVRVHVLYESNDLRTPFGSSFIRLLRPLGHASLKDRIDLSFGTALPDREVDVVVVDRLWRSDLTPAMQAALFAELAARRLPMLHSLDDNLLDLGVEPGRSAFPSASQRNLIREFVRNAAGILVSTVPLAERLRPLGRAVTVLPNQLDESLYGDVPPRRPAGTGVVLGYMGTPTHLDDLLSIVGPLRRVLRSAGGRVRLEVVGVADPRRIDALFEGLPVTVLQVPSASVRYPEFVAWMKASMHWHVGLAPLRDDRFNASKSDIKFLDYGLLGIPGLFSRVPSYRDTVRDGVDGLLVDGTPDAWQLALETITAESAAPLRAGLADAVQRRVSDERTLARHAQAWADWIETALGAAAAAPPPRPIHFAAPTDAAVLRATAPSPTATDGAAQAPAVPDPAVPAPSSRQQKLLRRVDLSGLGLEIGASYSPLLPKSRGHRIETLDHASQEELIAKYASSGVDTSRIEPVDHVWRGEPLDALIGQTERYDYILASHVIEHTPDLVAFLQQCERLLKPGGVLSLAVPDQRYCFDVLRPVSTPGDVLQAHLERRSRHSAGAVFDHFATIAFREGQPSWHPGAKGRLALLHTMDEAVAMYEKAAGGGEYVDIHNWRFTPASMALILRDLLALKLLRLVPCDDVAPEGMEFFVILRKVDADALPAPGDRLAMALSARDEWTRAD